MNEELKQQIIAAVAANEEVKATVQKILSLSAEEFDQLKQIMQENQDNPVMEEADERNNPGPGVV